MRSNATDFITESLFLKRNKKKECEVLCSLVTGGSTIKGVLGGDDCNITLYVTGQVGLCSHSVHKRAGWCVNSYTT